MASSCPVKAAKGENWAALLALGIRGYLDSGRGRLMISSYLLLMPCALLSAGCVPWSLLPLPGSCPSAEHFCHSVHGSSGWPPVSCVLSGAVPVPALPASASQHNR